MTAPADLARRAREAASSSESVRERLSELITLAAEARRLEDPAERRAAEVAIYEAARPLLEADERPVRRPADPPAPDAVGRGIREAARRRARREALLPRSAEVPVEGPRWSGRILDTGEELLGIHRDTANVFPVRLFRDLDEEASGAVVARRIVAAGGSLPEVGRALEALGLEERVRRRIVAALGGVG